MLVLPPLAKTTPMECRFEMQAIELRRPCTRCKHDIGQVTTKGGQDCVYCVQCGSYQYNAPKTETGRKTRSVSTTHQMIKPKQRSRIIDRANGRCERCGATKEATRTGLHVGHVVSVEAGHKYGLTDQEINDDENLIAECDQCNLGHGKMPVPLRVYVAIIATRLRENP